MDHTVELARALLKQIIANSGLHASEYLGRGRKPTRAEIDAAEEQLRKKGLLR
jgi:hypothetical protein